MRRQVGVIAMSPVLLIGVASGGEDDDSAAATNNILRITESEYEFAVEGELEAGSVSIAVENVGEEFHEIAMGRLLDGHTVDDVRAALEAADEEADNPLDGILEDDSVIDDLGGVQAPGTAYTISGGGVEAGDYVLLCFISNSEGVEHHSLGMVTGFTVAEGEVSEVPTPDVTYTIGDDGLDGPTQLGTGETSIEVVNDSSTSREITLLKIAEGSTIEDVVAFFESGDEGPPDFAGGPLDFLAFVFDAESDRTITVDLTAGQWALQTPDPGQPFEGPPTEDPHTILVTVS
jgi:hypothetical protein